MLAQKRGAILVAGLALFDILVICRPKTFAITVNISFIVASSIRPGEFLLSKP
jgi:hypothetical protein